MRNSAIFGLRQAGGQRAAEHMGNRLIHRGAHQHVFSPCPDVFLGMRCDQTAPPADALPVVFNGGAVDRAELLALYERQGLDVLSFLEEPFELALYDKRRDALVVAVHRNACRPLYVAMFEGSWAFATEIKALLGLDGLTASVDPFVAKAWLMTQSLSGPASLLAGVRRVLPGEVLVVENGRAKPGRLGGAHPAAPTARVNGDPLPDLRRAIVTAARRLTAHYDRIGVALTPGLGSLLALGAVKWVNRDKRVHTYAVGFDEHDPFLAQAARVARHFRTDHREIVVSAETTQSLLPELVWQAEDPVAPERMLEYLLIAHQAAREVPLLVNGHACMAVSRSPHSMAQSRLDMAALERVHTWAGIELGSLFQDADVVACSERALLKAGTSSRGWSAVVRAAAAGFIDPALAKMALEPARGRLAPSYRAQLEALCGSQWPQLVLESWCRKFLPPSVPAPPR